MIHLSVLFSILLCSAIFSLLSLLISALLVWSCFRNPQYPSEPSSWAHSRRSNSKIFSYYSLFINKWYKLFSFVMIKIHKQILYNSFIQSHELSPIQCASFKVIPISMNVFKCARKSILLIHQLLVFSLHLLHIFFVFVIYNLNQLP